MYMRLVIHPSSSFPPIQLVTVNTFSDLCVRLYRGRGRELHGMLAYRTVARTLQ